MGRGPRGELAQAQCAHMGRLSPSQRVVVPVPSRRHVKVGELVRSSSRRAWRVWDGFLLEFLRGGFGLSGPAVAAFHRGGDSEAALPAAGAPDDGTLLGEVHGQAWAKVGQSG